MFNCFRSDLNIFPLSSGISELLSHLSINRGCASQTCLNNEALTSLISFVYLFDFTYNKTVVSKAKRARRSPVVQPLEICRSLSKQTTRYFITIQFVHCGFSIIIKSKRLLHKCHIFSITRARFIICDPNIRCYDYIHCVNP